MDNIKESLSAEVCHYIRVFIVLTNNMLFVFIIEDY